MMQQWLFPVQEADHWIYLPLDAVELGVRFPKRGKTNTKFPLPIA